MRSRGIGTMREELLVQRNDPQALSLTSLTRTGTTATATTTAAHGLATGDYVQHAGADQSAYNVKAKITVTGPTTYTFTVAGSPATPATGTLTAIYVSDAQGGRDIDWRTLDTIAAEMIPIGANERLQAAAVQSIVTYRFRVRARGDISPAMRAIWTPSWLSDVAAKTLQIVGIVPADDGRAFMFLECGVVG